MPAEEPLKLKLTTWPHILEVLGRCFWAEQAAQVVDRESQRQASVLALALARCRVRHSLSDFRCDDVLQRLGPLAEGLWMQESLSTFNLGATHVRHF